MQELDRMTKNNKTKFQLISEFIDHCNKYGLNRRYVTFNGKDKVKKYNNYMEKNGVIYNYALKLHARGKALYIILYAIRPNYDHKPHNIYSRVITPYADAKVVTFSYRELNFCIDIVKKRK